MRIMRARTGLALAAVLALPWAAPAAAQPSKAAITCEAEKLKTAGRYGLCRLGVEAKAVNKGAAPNYAKCDRQYGVRWTAIETRAGEHCPVTGDQAALQELVSECTDDVAAAIAGEDLESCAVEIAECAAELAACGGEVGTCNAGLVACATSLDTCTGSLDTCSGDLAVAQGTLGTCTGTLAACEHDRDDAQATLATCSSDLTTCGDDRDDAQAALASCSDGLTTCEDDLAHCNATIDTCSADLAACQAAPQGQLRRTGQTTCYDGLGNVIACAGTAQDAALLKGLTVSFTDNGDGTITDHRTGLMWQKQSDDGSTLDKDTASSWTSAAGSRMTALNSMAFAGYTDWRLPNINELQSLLNFGAANPAVHAPFHTGCTEGCTVLECSCTRPSFYWSSSTSHMMLNHAWYVNFSTGLVDFQSKVINTDRSVRAVRGGS